MTLLRSAVLLLVPAGGQATARRNAWAGMSANAARARASREADEALRLAALRAARAGDAAAAAR